MRVVVDLQRAQVEYLLNGVEGCSLCLAKALLRNARQHEFWFVLNSLFPTAIEPLRGALHQWIDPNRVVVLHLPGPAVEFDSQNLSANHWQAHAAELIRDYALAEYAPDIVLVDSLFEGWLKNGVISSGARSLRFR